jgi:hypothetical protein
MERGEGGILADTRDIEGDARYLLHGVKPMLDRNSYR